MGKNEGKEIKAESCLPGRVAQEFEVQAKEIGARAGPRWQRESRHLMSENQKKNGADESPPSTDVFAARDHTRERKKVKERQKEKR